MKFHCNSVILQKAISIAEKAISSRSTLPIMENLFFELNGDKLKLRGNDLEIGIEYTIPVEKADELGAVLVKAKTVSSIVSKLNNQMVEFSVDENKHVTLKTDRVEFDIHGLATDEYPVFPSIEEGTQFKISVGQLRDMIKYTIFSVSSDETRQFLNGILVKAEEGKLFFISTDGFRLSLRFLEGYQDLHFSAIVPHKAVGELQKIIQPFDAETEVRVNISENQIAFQMPNFVLVSRLVQGQFPDYKQVVPKYSSHQFEVDRKALVEACERATIIASASNNVVRLTFSESVMVLRAVSPNMGDYKEDLLVVKKRGEGDAKIAFNVRLLSEVLRTAEGDTISLEFNAELSPTVVKAVPEEPYLYVVMPIRTSDFGIA